MKSNDSAEARTQLAQQLALSYALADRMSAKGLEGYLNSVVINSAPEPKKFSLLAEPWQWDYQHSIRPMLESLAGINPGYTGPTSFWWTLPRGHDKTSAIGRIINWLLGYSRRRLSLVTAAADRDQAGLIGEAMDSELKLNPWLADKIKWGQKTIRGPGGVLRILSADAKSSSGLNADFYLVDELTHWTKRDLWDILWSGRLKRTRSVFGVITNAGTRGSWQWEIHEMAKSDPRWIVKDTPEGVRLARWMDESAVAKLRSMLTRGLAKRVLDNIWIDPAEEADYLTRLEIELCEILGRDLGLTYTPVGLRGIRYVAGIDYGPKRDRTALSVVHVDDTRRVLVDRLDVWQGSPEAPIQIKAVEEWIKEVNESYHYPDLVIDPYQMEGTIQDFEIHQRVETFEARGGKKNYEMAENLRSLITNKRIAWYPGAGSLIVNGKVETLIDEMAGLVVVPTPYGYRFDHKAAFHDDRSVSLGMAALHAVTMDRSGPGVPPTALKKKPALDLRSMQPARSLYGIEV